MDAHGGAAGDGSVVVGGINVQLVQGMAALVGHAVQVTEHIAGHVMGGDAHIAAPELGGKGMFALGQVAVGRVQTPQLHDLLADLALGVDGPILVQEVGADGGAVVADVGQQRHDGLPQGGEEFIALGDGQAVLVLIQQHLVRVAVGGKVVGLGAAGSHDLLQIRCKYAEIVGALGLDPGGDALLGQLGKGGVLVSRDLGDLVVGTLQFPYLGALLLGLGILGCLAQQSGGVVVDQQVEVGAAQHLAGFGAAIGAALGGDGFSVKIHHVQGVAVGKALLLQRTKADNAFFHSKTSFLANTFSHHTTKRRFFPLKTGQIYGMVGIL